MHPCDFLYKKNHESLDVAFNQNKWEKVIKKINWENKLPVNGREYWKEDAFWSRFMYKDDSAFYLKYFFLLGENM